MAAGRASPRAVTRPPPDRRDGQGLKKVGARSSCLHLSGRLSMVLCHGLYIGEELCFWDTPGAPEAQP